MARSYTNDAGQTKDADGVFIIDAAGKTPGDVGYVAPQVSAGDPASITATIANTASLSGSTKVGGKLVGIITPATWTAAGLTFQGSQDGTNFFDLYDDATERMIASASIPASGARMLSLDLNDWLCVNFVKLRSGPSAGAVAQGGSRVFTLILAG